jgi:hypothetical protein
VYAAIINKTVMKYSRQGNRVSWCCLFPSLRTFVAVLLVALVGIGILPFGFVECLPSTPDELRERSLRIETLQVCDDGDSLIGVLFDLPVLLPGTPHLQPSAGTLLLVRQAMAFVPDGFHPSIDHPPQLSA